MADKSLVHKDLGELEFDLALTTDGNVAIITKYEGEGGGVEVKGYVKSEYFLSKLKNLTPDWGDMLIDLAAGTLIKKGG